MQNQHFCVASTKHGLIITCNAFSVLYAGCEEEVVHLFSSYFSPKKDKLRFLFFFLCFRTNRNLAAFRASCRPTNENVSWRYVHKRSNLGSDPRHSLWRSTWSAHCHLFFFSGMTFFVDLIAGCLFFSLYLLIQFFPFTFLMYVI